MESLSDQALCLQDLVTGVTTSSANTDIHHGVHHHLHDSVSSAVSVSSAISGIMSGSSSSVLGHHVTSHDPHHHGVVPHTPSLHHEPLEKLKRGESFLRCFYLLFLIICFHCLILNVLHYFGNFLNNILN